MSELEIRVRDKYNRITKTLIEKELTITTMESCTSGLIISLLTDTEGSSAAVKGAFVTYSNEAKIKNGVPKEIIDKYGVYSKETSVAMADAAKASYGADISIGVTGTMGNIDPANNDSHPGEVFFSIASTKGISSYHVNIPVKESRYDYKLFVADLVADKIIDVI